MTALHRLSAIEIVAGLRRRDFSAEDVTRASLSRIEELEPRHQAFACIDPQFALTQAREIDRRIGAAERLGELAGVPLGVKDVFNTMDLPTCMGSPIWAGFTPGNDARAVAYARWAGAVLVGKTNTAEFAVHHLHSDTPNPWHPEFSPGTSSSGSAVAVATEMVPLAFGTQTAGSTIRPASYCGVFGYKPSFGLVARVGLLKTLDTLDHVTFFSRAAGDLEAFLTAVRQRGHNFPFIERLVDPFENAAPPEKWKVAFVRTPVWNDAEDYAREAIEKYVRELEGLPFVELTEAEMPAEFERAHEIHDTLYTKALSYYFQEEVDAHPEKISAVFLEMSQRGRRISVEKYRENLALQSGLVKRFDEFSAPYDALITLSTAGVAPRGINTRENRDSCLIWTLCHAPAMNLPVFRGPHGLPFGAQLVGRRYSDYTLIRLARRLQAEGLVRDWRENPAGDPLVSRM